MQTELEDHRDPRGRVHNLGFVLSGVLVAILLGRNRLSSIQRFIANRFEDLCAWTGCQAEKAVSDTQLRRILRGVDWEKYNELNAAHFNLKIEQVSPEEWVAMDGKELRGSLERDENGDKANRGEVVVNAVRHEDSQVVGQTYYRGDKESEKIAVRELLHKGLSEKSTTLDALHCDPETTALIEQGGGRYIVQAKANQAELMEELHLSTGFLPALHRFSEVDKAHGRIETRKAELFDIQGGDFEQRWQSSGIRALIKVQRHFIEVKTGKEQDQTSLYISNQAIDKHSGSTAEELFHAVRKHWAIEADNHVRDVLFLEDSTPTPKGASSRSLAAIRTFAIQALRQTGAKSLKAKMEQLVDCPQKLAQTLGAMGFFT